MQAQRRNPDTRWTRNSNTPSLLRVVLQDGSEFGGRGRARTGGLLVANEALSQLSYTPTAIFILANQGITTNCVSEGYNGTGALRCWKEEGGREPCHET